MRSGKLIIGVVLFIAGNVSFAQSSDDPMMDVGFKPYGSYHGGDLDSINLSNGFLNIHIPVGSFPQRGAIGYTPQIIYNNHKGWSVLPDCTNQNTCSPLWQWKGSSVTLNIQSEDFFAAGPGPYTQKSKIVVYRGVTADAATHQMAITTAGSAESIDGSGIWQNGSAFGVPGFSRDRHGMQNLVPLGGPLLEDANGNIFGTPSGIFNILDTLGRILPNASSGTATTDFSGCTGPLPFTSAVIISFPRYGGATGSIKTCGVTVQLQSNFQASGYYNDLLFPIAEAHPSVSLLQSVVLYNGSSWTSSLAWTFEYSSRAPGDSASVNYGDLTKITLPTGGTISYTWTNIPTCDPNDPVPFTRGVATRIVNANDSSVPQKWTYNNGTVTDPAGNDTVHTFTGLNASCSLYETQTQYFQGPKFSGPLLKTVKADYRWMANPFDSLDDTETTPTVTNVFPIRTTTIWPNGKTTKIEKDYDSQLVFSVPGRGQFTGSYGNVLETREYDFGDGAPGPLLRTTDYTYRAFDGSPSAASYRTANLINLVSTVKVYDGGSHLVSQTDYGYDESPLQPSGVSTQFTTSPPNAGVRGNRTSESHWLNTTGNKLISTASYYDTGTPYEVTDPGGHKSTNFYGSGFQTGSAFAGAYVTQTQNALLQSAYFDYDFSTGLQTATKDANGAVSTADYDLYGRTRHHNAPDGGITTWNYTDSQPPIFTVTSPIDGVNTRNSEGDLDGLGRMMRSKLLSDPDGTDTVDTTYDGLGRVATVTNPHRTAAGATDGITTPIYDALGRVTQITKQDGSISKMAYNVQTTIPVNAECNIATDEAGKQRGECFDALGRLVEVDEPTVTPLQANNHVTLQTDGNFVLYSPASSALWSTGTSGSNAGPIFMQDDGNLVLYLFKWQAGTYATPSPGPFPAQGCNIGSYLMIGQRLNPNQCLVSPHGQYMLYMASDGNFFIYDLAHNVGTWGPGTTYGHPGAYAIMQGDGNFCVDTAQNTFLWCSGTNGTNAERIDMEDDGRIIVYKSAWSSGTSDGQFNGTVIAHPGCDVGIAMGWTGAMGAGQCLVSPNGHFELLMQGDGNLVIYDLSVSPAHALWSTNTGTLPTDPAVAMRTLYSYDTLGNLLRVDQKGTAPSDSTQWRTRTFTYDSLSRLLTANNPESGTITYSYDADGNLLQKTSPAPNQTGTATQTVSYCYDALHRVIGKGYGAQSCPLATPVVTYAYDSGTNAKGHLTSLTDQAGTASYTYDIMGRLATETRPIAGISKTTSYTYTLDGSVKTLTYPSGRVVTYSPDSAGRLVSAVDGNGTHYVTSATYNPDDSLKSLLNGSTPALNQNFQYTHRLQLCRMTAITAGTMPTSCGDTNIGNVMDRGYNFNDGAGDNGNVMAIINYRDANRSQAFTYDALNRLTSGWSSANTGAYSWGETYSIDAWGNLQISPMGGKAHGGNFTLSGNAQNRPTGLAYDAAGNLTSYVSSTYIYDQENRLSSTSGMSYTYDGNGDRVLKFNTSSGAAVKRYWSMGGNMLAEADGSGNLTAEYIYFGGKRVARIDLPANSVHYYLSDHLNSTSIVVSSSGIPEEESDYSPYGTEYVITGVGVNRYKFTGKERDSETGLDDFIARHYGSPFGRFMQADVGVDQHPQDPQSWNIYAYSRNNPLRFTDPTGNYLCGTGMNENQCDDFENQLGSAQQKADQLKQMYGPNSSQYLDTQRAIDAFGAQGEDNGVTVNIGQTSTGAVAETDANNPLQQKTTQNPTGQDIQVTLSPGLIESTKPTATMAIAHEGSHVADAEDWAKAGFTGSPTHFQTEFRAYGVTSALGDAFGFQSLSGSRPNSPPHLFWNKGFTDAGNDVFRSIMIKATYPNWQNDAFKLNTQGGH